MNTIGKILKDARQSKNITFSKLESITKIKKDFLIKIENEDWNNLPEFAVVSGFVKNIANSLELPIDSTNAVLRRDYPPKKLAINPKPDISQKLTWSPKLTFAIGVITLVLLVLTYLGIEYQKFTKSPELVINSPKESEVINQNTVKISGRTTTDAVVTVNNQPITLDQDGGFDTLLEVTKDTDKLLFKAVSRSGKVTEKTVDISVE